MNVNIIDTKHIHGKNLRDHATKARNEELRIVENIVARYEAFRNGIDAINSLTHHDIREMVTFLNEYRRFSVTYFDQLDNSGQQALG